MEYWQVVHVMGGYEDKIRDFLNKDSRNIAFIPKKKKIYRKRGVNNIEESILFPNYVFVKTSMNHFEFMENVQLFLTGIEGFLKILKHDMTGTESLYPHEISFLKRLLNEDFSVDESRGIFEGDTVLVLDGPLVGCESLIRKIDRHKRLAWIEMSMFGETRRMSVPLEIIGKK